MVLAYFFLNVRRSVLINLDAGESLFSKVKVNFGGDNGFLVFTGLVIKTVQLRTKEAYQTIEHSYDQFLESDPAFNSLYKWFGQKFFGVEKQQSGGLMSLLQ